MSQEAELKLLPNFNEVSVQDLEGFTENGSVGTEYNRAVGRDISRQFNAGDRVEDVLQLGDLKNSLAPEQFTLNDISKRSSQTNDFSVLPLSEFALIEKQTIEDLVKAIPDLGREQIDNVKPIATLLEQNGLSTEGNVNSLIENPSTAQLKLGSTELGNFTVDSIPNLTDTELEKFEGFESSTISDIPELASVPLGNFPQGISSVGSVVARIDFVWGEAESDRNNTISGSYVEGFNVSCDSDCEYLELDDLENTGSTVQLPFEGKQWIAGREHWVRGGTGCFSGGKEPTGIHPFCDTFKLVLWRTNETDDTAEIVMFFNIKTQCGSSPYFIGPIPFPLGLVRINDYVFIGVGG